MCLINVITDYNMSKMSWIDILQAVTAIDKTKSDKKKMATTEHNDMHIHKRQWKNYYNDSAQ